LTVFAILGVLALFLAPDPGRATASTPSRWFWVLRGSGVTHIQCVELARGVSTEVYASPNAQVSRSEAGSLVATFEAHILPTDIRLFGMPRQLGKVIVLLVPLGTSTLGYFDENDLLRPTSPGADLAHSNRGNVLYINPEAGVIGPARTTDTNEVIAHELQHLIEYRIRVLDHAFPPEDLWLNEGLSFYAQVANGFWTQSDALKVRSAAQMPAWPVTALGAGTEFLRQHARVAYGRAGLFVSYLASRFGDAFLRAVVASRLRGLSAIDAVLGTLTPRTDVTHVFADWGVASYLNRIGTYGYGTLPKTIQPRLSLLLPAIGSYPFDSQKSTRGLHLTPWGNGYLQFTISKAADVRLNISGPAAHLSAAVVLQDSHGAVATEIHRVTFQASGRGSLIIRGFGGFYDRLTIVMSDVGPISQSSQFPSDAIRVSADLVHVRNHD
jgi:hypothetical protein